MPCSRKTCGLLGAEQSARGSVVARAEEGPERARQRHLAQVAQSGALSLLATREIGALLTLAQMGAKRPALAEPQPVVELAGDRALGLVAGQRALQPLAQRPPSAEDERLRFGDRHVENLSDLLVGATLDLAHDERSALLEGQMAERPPDVLAARRLAVRDRPLGVVIQLRGSVPEALQADSVRDREQPAPGAPWPGPALEGRIGVPEGRLRDVLGVLGGGQQSERVPVDVENVLAVQALVGAIRALPQR